MKKIVLILQIAFLFASTGIKAQTSFTEVDVRSAAKVIIDYGSKCSYRLSDSSYTDKMNIFVHGNKLIIDTKINEYSSMPVVYVTMPKIEKINVDGAGKAVISGNFEIEKLKADITGTAIIKIMERPVINTIDVTISGAGGVKIETIKHVSFAKVDISGAGFFSADNTCIENLKIDISGAAVANVCVSKSIKANISGLGVLTYSGDPKTRKINNYGLGIVQIKN